MEANINTRARRFVVPRKDIGMCAGTLLNDWKAHLAGRSRFLDLFYKFYGKSSPAGRIMNQNLNRMTTTNLSSDFRYLGEDYHCWSYENNESNPEPSAAAQRIRACCDSILVQDFWSRRRIPPTPEIDAALSAYVDERASLLRRIETLFDDGYKATRAKWVLGWVKTAAQERKAIEQLKTKLR